MLIFILFSLLQVHYLSYILLFALYHELRQVSQIANDILCEL